MDLMQKVVASGLVAVTRTHRAVANQISPVLCRNALGLQRKPGPGAILAACAASQSNDAQQSLRPCLRLPFDAGARHRRGRDSAHHRGSFRQEGGRRFLLLLPARISARGQFDPRLRQASPSPSSAATMTIHYDRLRSLFGHLPCEFYPHQRALSRNGQILLQQFPRPQDHLRQSKPPAFARRWASIPSR